MSSTTLFSPFQLKNYKNYTLKNRVGVAPMTRMSSIRDSVPRQDVLDFLVRRAESNAAIVFTEAIVTDYESAQGYPGQARPGSPWSGPCKSMAALPSCRCFIAAAWHGPRSIQP
jgi:2,4-dienoyl-CoA reductase-like NADH-dependent reductase (Old Yellow Enzyme family)